MSMLDWLHDRLSLVPRGPGTFRWDAYVPEEMRHNEELLRRCRLQIRFGWLGAMFGMVYALFYLLVGHRAGAEVILACSAVFAICPWLLKRRADLVFTGHMFSAVLLVGFSALSVIEGGLQGHAIAWIASIPLCSLLLLDIRRALVWASVSLLVIVIFSAVDLLGIRFPTLYSLEHDDLISAAGYVGLVGFMALLGITFERLRARSYLQMEKALAELSFANQRLMKVNIEKDEILKIAAHDLKNPLGGISGYSELLMLHNPPTKEEVDASALVIRKLSQRMLDIVNNLLNVQRIEEGSLKIKPTRCPVGPLLQEIASDHTQRASKKRIALIVDPAAEGLSVCADEGAVQQILDNLISNAIKYSPAGTTIHCASHEYPAGVVIDIRDEGPGLSEADQEHLFKKFSRLTPRPTGGEGSHGLGLWIVQRMAASMGGDVRCTSELGKGSTFSLVLPKWNVEPGEAAEDVEAGSASHGGADAERRRLVRCGV